MEIKIAIPKDLEGISQYLHEISVEAQSIETEVSKLNNNIDELKKAAQLKISEHEKLIDELFKQIYAYAKEHRDELTNKGKVKTVKLKSGKIYWRKGKEVIINKGRDREIIRKLKQRKLFSFIRTKVKEEINKLAIRDKPSLIEGIRGIKISNKEFFYAIPEQVNKNISLRIEV